MYASVAISLPRDASVTPWGQAVTGQEGQVNAGTAAVVACFGRAANNACLVGCWYAFTL